MKEVLVESVKKIIRENLSVDSSLDCTGSFPRTKRTLQHMGLIKLSDPNLRALYEIILTHAFRAEVLCPTAGRLLLQEFSDKNRDTDNRPVRNKSDLRLLIQNTISVEKIYQILMCVLELASSGTKITVKKSSGQRAYIESSEGYVFDLKSLVRIDPCQFDHVRAVCIDGFIENVSEIHHLLTHLSETKTPCILLSRGLSDEVLHTIKVNLDRKTVFVYPYLVPFDPVNSNTLVDVAIAGGTDVISSTKGDLISSARPEMLGNFETCILSSASIRLKNSKTRKRVSEHVRDLNKRLLERPEIEDILSKRIKSLTSSCVDINIPDDIEFYSMSQQLDEGIRLIQAVLNNTFNPRKVVDEIMPSLAMTIRETSMFTLNQE